MVIARAMNLDPRAVLDMPQQIIDDVLIVLKTEAAEARVAAHRAENEY